MKIAITGATGFLGRYLAAQLAGSGHSLACWRRPTSNLSGFPALADPRAITWVEGSLNDEASMKALVAGADAVVHSALDHPPGVFRLSEANLIPSAMTNILGSLRLIEAARAAGVGRFVFISTCAVHDRILPDRPLDETHPLWMSNHYGASKAAVEAFVHSYGFGEGYPICALRPTGIYGLASPPESSKWFGLVRSVAANETVTCTRGGKEVHALDVARAVEILLNADPKAMTGEAFNCCDRYISEFEVASIAKELTRSNGPIHGETTRPKNQIETTKLEALGMTFGGEPLLRETIRQMIESR